MIGAAVATIQGRITGAHRTWLDPSGRDKAVVDTPRRAMGHLLGNASPPSVRQAMRDGRLGEGIETMLSLRCVIPGMGDGRSTLGRASRSHPVPAALRRLYIVLTTIRPAMAR